MEWNNKVDKNDAGMKSSLDLREKSDEIPLQIFTIFYIFVKFVYM